MRVIIVDDDPLVSEALKVILDNEADIEVQAVASGGREALAMIKDAKAHSSLPDVVILDIRMDDMNGLDSASEILKISNEIKILFLTTFLDDTYINRALNIGAGGYILKQDCSTLASSVRAVAAGLKVFGGRIVDKLPDLLNRKENFDYSEFDINEKEQHLITLAADGLSNKEIAEKIFLSEGTVRNLMSSVLSKLGLRDRTQLVCFYYQKIKP